jgi:MFS family permease
MSGISEKKAWATLAALSAASALVYLLQAGLGTVLPDIGADLGMSLTAQQWTVTGLSLAASVFLVLTGRLCDVIGRKRSLLIGTGVYGLALVAASLAPGGAILIAACVLAGVGAAFIFPAGLATLRVVFDQERIDMALGIWIGAWALLFGLAPIITGLLAEHVSWRAIFWLQLPFVIVSFIAFVVVTPESRPGKGGRLPYAGLAALTGGLSCLCLGLGQSDQWGWGSPKVIALIALGAGLLALFKPLDERSDVHVVDPLLWRDRNFIGGIAVLNLFNFVLLPVVVYGPQYLQIVLGHGPLAAGILFAPAMIGVVLGPMVTGWIGQRIPGDWFFLGGAVLLAVASLWLVLLPDPATYDQLVLPLILLGLGVGMLVETTVAVAVRDVPEERSGAASGLTLVGSFLGGSIGLALASAVLTSSERGFSGAHSTATTFALAFSRSMEVPLVGAFVAVMVATFLVVRSRKPRQSPEP